MVYKKQISETLKEVDDGAYDVEIESVFFNDKENNLNFKFVNIKESKKTVFYIPLYLNGKNDEMNPFTETQLNDLLSILGINEISDVNGRIPVLANKEIGVIVKMSKYNGYENINLVKFYDVKTGKTAYELENDLEATYLDKKIDELEKEDERDI